MTVYKLLLTCALALILGFVFVSAITGCEIPHTGDKNVSTRR